jgi:ubiquinone/menaquinone biosynthesis C-methylase UbiE
MEDVNKTYLPAAGVDWALPLYDPLLKLLGGDKARQVLLDQTAAQLMRCVLDIGCGTGTLAVLIKQRYPDVDFVGLDPDPKALGRAARKARGVPVSIRFDRGSSDALPYPDASFDRVFSSFMLHHLRPDQRGRTLREVFRVLASGGSFHLLDFERAEGSALLARVVQSSHHLEHNSEQRIIALLREAGFRSANKIMTGKMLFGLLRMGYYRASVTAQESRLPAG